ncbi:hypothetical protein VNO77_14555 [Canavalia gladiata]|uniref:Uncharacterized protein n=1 Tax=Canavalia gladiata TaxID=3824 RepID=A0AAN9LYT4_CANGL
MDILVISVAGTGKGFSDFSKVIVRHIWFALVDPLHILSTSFCKGLSLNLLEWAKCWENLDVMMIMGSSAVFFVAPLLSPLAVSLPIV